MEKSLQKKYRKNFVIRIPRTISKSDDLKIFITKTTLPASIEYEIPTRTSEETTNYYYTYSYDFISLKINIKITFANLNC
ncbi:hypothetical protein H8356DRAFT_1357713 [Neocallimastix lanati (nom. inval.)]|nr:hypothetical protein H8356DRAFT_1357713 [Neocallimastix sp. JGI-2020a]